MLVSVPVTADISGEIAPVNPYYAEYLSQQNALSVEESADACTEDSCPAKADGHRFGDIPGLVQIVWAPEGMQGGVNSFDAATPTDSYFSLVDEGRVTPVKNQGNCGSCWAFAAIGSLESWVLSDTGVTWDLSENNMKNLMSENSATGWDLGACSGGNAAMSTAYLARWSGPILESEDPYSPYSSVSPSGLIPVMHTQNVITLPPRTDALDNDLIKQYLVNEGALKVAILWNDLYAGSYDAHSDATYYFPSGGVSQGGHAILIVGWDDTFSATNFRNTPPGDGAFICKNSWGTSSGINGYFYVSYYDDNIGWNARPDIVLYTSEDVDAYDTNYQYDPLGWTSSAWYGSKQESWFANVFTAAGSESLDAVSFYATGEGMDYEIRVYVNPDGDVTDSGGPVATQTGSLLYPGYYTIPLSTLVPLSAGDTFSVAVGATYEYDTYTIPLEKAGTYTSQASASAGQSYVSATGSYYSDATGAFDSTTNVCLKAFTTDRTGVEIGIITPAEGENTGPVSVVITGDLFTSVPDAVILERTGQTSIPGTGVSLLNSTAVACTFDLTGAEVGLWTLNVTHEGSSSSLVNAFTVGYPAPVMTAILPVRGTTGTTLGVTMNGTGFLGTPAATLINTTLGESLAVGNITLVSGNELSGVVNLTGISPGIYDATVTNPDGKNGTAAGIFTVRPPVTVTGISPSEGANGGPVAVTITGTRFADTPAVCLEKAGEDSISGTGVVRTNETSLSCTIDLSSVSVGAWTVNVTSEGDSGYLTDEFMVTYAPPVIGNVSPATVATGFSHTFTVEGSGFQDTPSLLFHNVSSGRSVVPDSVTFNASDELSCTVDFMGVQPGLYDLCVTNPDNGNVTREDVLSVTADIAVTGIDPSVVSPSESVYITSLSGNGFYGTPSVILRMAGEADHTPDYIFVESPTVIRCGFNLEGAAPGTWDVIVADEFGYGTGTLPAGLLISGSISLPYALDIPVSGGWNMISFPARGSSVVLTSNMSPTLYAYNPVLGQYVATTAGSVQPGTGYWVAGTLPEEVNLTGEGLGMYQIPLTAGWNFVGSVASDRPTGNFTTVPEGILAGSVYWYNPSLGQYVTVSEISAGKGYWVSATAPGLLLLS